MSAGAEPIPEEFSPKHLRRRLLQVGAILAVVVAVVVLGPGLGSLRSQFENASPAWLLAAVGLKVVSALSYIVIFRAVFCPSMSWRLSYQMGMSEQGANSVLSVSGAGGLALGVWALRRGGMSAEHIGRRTVAFFFLTSFANVATVIFFAALFAVGILQHNRDAVLTYGFGVAALLATGLVVALPFLLDPKHRSTWSAGKQGRLAAAVHFARHSLVLGVRDGLALLRARSIGVLVGAFGLMAFDMAVLWATFRAVGHTPPFGVLVIAYLIGQLGGNIPIPGGIGGIDAGLIGVFVLYHQPLAATTAAVLLYHAITLWVPALLGSLAFVQLRRTLSREDRPAAMCAPLAEPIEVVEVAVPHS